MSQKNTQMNRARMHSFIPYRHCYEEGGMIETLEGVYTRGFRVLPPEGEVKGNYNSKATKIFMENILVKLSENFLFEFTIRNRHMDKEKYLSQITIEEKADDYTYLRQQYNKVLQDNCDIGHNNFLRESFLTVSVEAVTPDAALAQFEESETILKAAFLEMYGYRLVPMNLAERLEVLHSCYHPKLDAEPFGSKVDYDGKGFSFRSMQRMGMNTKDLISPEIYECSARDYLRIGNCYVRTFFINCLPESVPDSILLDLSSVSSNSILSVHYQSIDQELGYMVAAKHVKDNTEVRNTPIRETFSDRKEHRILRQEHNIQENENEYFYRSALNKFKHAKAKNQPIIQASFLITLYANSLEELNRDTALLYVSASKYVCQIRCLELNQQNEGFQSVLPLNYLKVNVGRMFSIEELAAMQPFNIYDIYDKVPTFYGLNAINDNFIFMDRGNYPIAMIAGGSTAGRIAAVKRETANTLMCTLDDVVILTKHLDRYKEYAELLSGQLVSEFHPDIFHKDANYNLNGEKSMLQKVFMEAYLAVKLSLYKERLSFEDIQEFDTRIGKEAEILSRFDSWNEALGYAKEHLAELQFFVKALEGQFFTDDSLRGEKRLTIVHYDSEAELVVNLDYLWNHAVALKKKNKTLWIYVEGADELAYSTAASDYLISIMERAEILRIPVTLVIHDVVHIVTNQAAAIEFDYWLNKVRYFKLLSLGPVERKHFVEKLNISQQLIPYFVDSGIGEGVMVTPSSNIAFNDCFESKENEFYRMFY